MNAKSSRTTTMMVKWIAPRVIEISPPEDWSTLESLEHAKDNVKMLLDFTDNQTVGILAIIPDFVQSDEARRYYRQNLNSAICVALIGDSFVKKIVGNFLLGTLRFKAKMPIKIFSNEKEALIWVRSIMTQKMINI